MNRREMIKRASIGAGVIVLSPAILVEQGCAISKNADFYINLAANTLNQLSPLLPGAAGIIAKAIGVLEDIKKDYDKGDFSNASALLSDLDSVMIQIQNDAGLTSPTAKSIFAIAAIAIQTVATLILANPQAVSMAKMKLGARISTVERLGSASRADKVFQAVKF